MRLHLSICSELAEPRGYYYLLLRANRFRILARPSNSAVCCYISPVHWAKRTSLKGGYIDLTPYANRFSCLSVASLQTLVPNALAYACITCGRSAKHSLYCHKTAAMMRSMIACMGLLPSLARPGATAPQFLLRQYASPVNQTALIKELREKTGAPISDVKVRSFPRVSMATNVALFGAIAWQDLV